MNNFNSTVAKDSFEQRQWWVERWLELLDSYRYKKRLERARIYAREGNVLSIEFSDDRVIASVQGSEVEPYQVSLSLDVFTDEDWEYIVSNLAAKAIFSARLLAGEMPEDIDRVFTNSGLHLFPFSLIDIHSQCSCPDRANPCKHVGAVYYQLADRFSEDPFVLFQLRGRSKDSIIEAMRQFRKQNIEKSNNSEILPESPEQKRVKAKNTAKTTSKKTKTTKIDCLPPDLAKFWHYEESPLSANAVASPLTENKTPLDLLGVVPLPSNEATALRQYLSQVYQIVSGKE